MLAEVSVDQLPSQLHDKKPKDGYRTWQIQQGILLLPGHNLFSQQGCCVAASAIAGIGDRLLAILIEYPESVIMHAHRTILTHTLISWYYSLW